MSIPYIIILSDSEDEDYLMPDTNTPSNSDNESHHSASTEDDPSEEEAVPETPPLSPVHWTYDTSGPRTVQVPRKSVTGSHRRMNSSSEPTTPTTDPYRAARVWNWLPETLREWRKEERIPTITEVGESSTARQDFPFTKEPPHHTVPLLVTRMIRQEDRIDHIEDALIEMPGAEVVGEMQDQISNLGNHVEGVRDATEDLRQRATESAARSTDMERRITGIENSLGQLHTMADTLRDYTAFILKGDHIPKK